MKPSFLFSHVSVFLCDRLVLYGKYCSHVESAIACLDDICKNREDVRQMLEVRHCQTVFMKYLTGTFHEYGTLF